MQQTSPRDAAPPHDPSDATDDAIARLPPPVRRYYHATGFGRAPACASFQVVWQEALLRRSRQGGWLKLSCQQLNGVSEPSRSALMTARVAGIFPLECRETYRDGRASMHVKLLKLITLDDVRGPHMAESELVTILSEALLAPSVALQHYIAWTAIDETSAQAELTDVGVRVGGVFHFNERDELVRFDTRDRWQHGTPPRRYPWSAEFADYQEIDGMRLPTRLSATWHEPAGDFTYFRGTIASIRRNGSAR